MNKIQNHTTPLVSLSHATNKDDSGNTSAYLIIPALTQLHDGTVNPDQVLYALFAEGKSDITRKSMAAQLSVESMYRYMVDNYTSKSQIRYSLESALCHANSTLLRVAQQENIGDPLCTSALSACIDLDRFYITYVGNIHAYLLRSGLIYHLAHAITVDSNSIRSVHRNRPAEEARHYLGRTSIPLVKHISFNVTNTFSSYVYPPNRQIMNYLQLRADDTIVLCSSSISTALNPRDLGAIATAHNSQFAAEEITRAADEAAPDQYHTAIVLRQNQVERTSEVDYVMPTRHRNIAAMA